MDILNQILKAAPNATEIGDRAQAIREAVSMMKAGDAVMIAGHVITAHGTGDIRRNFVRILVGDRVVVRVSPFDVTRGRIIGRLAPGGRRQNGSDGSET